MMVWPEGVQTVKKLVFRSDTEWATGPRAVRADHRAHSSRSWYRASLELPNTPTRHGRSSTGSRNSTLYLRISPSSPLRRTGNVVEPPDSPSPAYHILMCQHKPVIARSGTENRGQELLGNGAIERELSALALYGRPAVTEHGGDDSQGVVSVEVATGAYRRVPEGGVHTPGHLPAPRVEKTMHGAARSKPGKRADLVAPLGGE